MIELQKDSIKLDKESERKVVAMILKLLEDKNGEVQNLASQMVFTLSDFLPNFFLYSDHDYTLKNAGLNTTQCWVKYGQTQRLFRFFYPIVKILGLKQPNRWVCPYFTQRWVVFSPAFF